MNAFELVLSGQIALLSASQGSGDTYTTPESESPSKRVLTRSERIAIIEECDTLECHSFDMTGAHPETFALAVGEW